MVRFPFLPLAFVISTRPSRFPRRQPGPFVEGLTQELRTGPAPVNPFLLAAALRHRRDTAIALDLRSCSVTLTLSSEGRDQTRHHYGPGAWQRGKDADIRMRCRSSCDPFIVLLNWVTIYLTD